jgi:hypothetical protein
MPSLFTDEQPSTLFQLIMAHRSPTISHNPRKSHKIPSVGSLKHDRVREFGLELRGVLVPSFRHSLPNTYTIIHSNSALYNILGHRLGDEYGERALLRRTMLCTLFQGISHVIESAKVICQASQFSHESTCRRPGMILAQHCETTVLVI